MLKRRLVSFGVIVATIAATTWSVASAAEWRLSTDQAADSAEGKGYERFAELVAKYTNGAITVKVFPYSQLGGEKAVLEQLSAGVVHVVPNALTSGAKWVPDMEYISAPFLFKDRAHWQRFMQSPLVKGWYKQMEDKGGVTVIGDTTAFLRGPYRVMVSSRPVTKLEDLKGLKLRMHVNELAVDAWNHLGADVRVVAWAEVYNALNRAMIDALNAPIGQTESIRVHEVAKFIGRHDEYWQSVVFYANARAYNGLSPQVKSAVDRAFVESAAYATDLVVGDLDQSIARMKKAGVTVGQVETAAFVERMRSFYEERAKARKLPAGFREAVEASR